MRPAHAHPGTLQAGRNRHCCRGHGDGLCTPLRPGDPRVAKRGENRPVPSHPSAALGLCQLRKQLPNFFPALHQGGRKSHRLTAVPRPRRGASSGRRQHCQPFPFATSRAAARPASRGDFRGPGPPRSPLLLPASERRSPPSVSGRERLAGARCPGCLPGASCPLFAEGRCRLQKKGGEKKPHLSRSFRLTFLVLRVCFF